MFIEKFKYASVVLPSIVLFFGVSVVCGWFLDIGWLKSIHPSFVTMKINTAIGFIFGAAALLAFYFNKKSLAGILGGMVFFLGAASLTQYIFSVDLGIDQLIIKDLDLVQTSSPGRMSPATALNFVFVGLSILLLGVGKLRTAVSLTLIPLLISFVSLAGYAFGAQSLYKIYIFTSIALHTSVLFVLLCLNIFVLQPRVAFVGILTENRLGGKFVRNFLPTIVLMPFIFGWIILFGEKLGYYDTIFSFSLFVVSTIVFMSISLFVYGNKVNLLDSQKYDLSLELSKKTKELMELSKNMDSNKHLQNTEEVIRLQDHVIMLESQLKNLYAQADDQKKVG